MWSPTESQLRHLKFDRRNANPLPRYDGSEHEGISARHLSQHDVYQPVLYQRELYEHNTYVDKRDVDGVLIAERDVHDADLFERDSSLVNALILD